MSRRRVLVVYGTRPEAIKVAPLTRALKQSSTLEPVIAVTGQHRHMLDQVNDLFELTPDYDLDIFEGGQGLGAITSRTLTGLEPVLTCADPDLVVVQGDTTTSFAAALGASYAKVPVAHLEAGLRTGNRDNPFPEELNRVLTARLAALHLAPTATSRENLLAEGVPASAIAVTGNTVIDALLDVAARDQPFDNPLLRALPEGPLVLVTAHRRESWGEPMRALGRALARLSVSFAQTQFVLPAHLNPKVREVLLPAIAHCPNVHVTPPLAYAEFAQLLKRSHLVLTDSGGIQEEAPSLGKPVLVTRTTTERPEAVAAGTVELVGTDEDHVVARVSDLLTSPAAYAAMAKAVNPYGDGSASARSVAAIEHYLGLGPRPQDFVPGTL